ncbi:hypothetical protein M8I34_19970 [Streptomyces sp. MCA2]|uniref:hypothetical protein n=1 Tax=Streptomyces sp. MCA2 TaxID=2944805 RepID=UPI002020834F|nr:hypothetical protein [Streptomyces sp. MCA2]MCL7493660.1 hypothetical protein [Streptomyces sp. MCA2]
MDWEGWGTAPSGYDAANLYLHSLPVPDLAERVRKEFSHILDASTGRVGELTACTEILPAAPRVPFYADVADAVRGRRETAAKPWRRRPNVCVSSRSARSTWHSIRGL